MVQHFRLQALLDPKLMYGLAISPIPMGSKEGNLLVQIISTCRHGLSGRGGGRPGQHPVVTCCVLLQDGAAEHPAVTCHRGEGED